MMASRLYSPGSRYELPLISRLSEKYLRGYRGSEACQAVGVDNVSYHGAQVRLNASMLCIKWQQQRAPLLLSSLLHAPSVPSSYPDFQLSSPAPRQVQDQHHGDAEGEARGRLKERPRGWLRCRLR